ncbi:MAG: beta-ketoacyl-ACP synthase II [Candidatus Nanopelagicales bacterium]|nr:beta-ketoacyl-ACP synthase II [Candidatus Nanopelagicales bacterium]
MRIAITGLGVTTPVGGDVATSWAALLAGRSGIRALPREWAQDLPVRFAGTLAEEPPLDRVEARRLDRSQQSAMVASREAWADAGSPEVDPLRMGTVIGTGIGGVITLLDAYDVLKERGPSRISPLTVPMLMPNGPAAVVGLAHNAAAGVHAPVSACASGAEAVAVAARMITDGRADVVIAGGTEAPIHPLTMAGFAAMRALSTRNDDPSAASRPYDIDRDGFVMGEGAGALILESEEHARARGARIYAYLIGAGLTADAHHIAQPDPEGRGAARAIQAALADGEASAEDVVHVNAHATSTPQGDSAEAVAIRLALGSAQPAVTGTKSMTGHMLGAAGAAESVFTVLALHHRRVPPTANLDHQDPSIDLDVVHGEPRQLPDGECVALNNSFGFGGHDVALAFRSA